jgi:histidine triad (HIT) family protein
MTDCVFCRIQKGEAAAQKVLENERIFAILDINPVAWGHVLVLPREHYETWTDLASDLLADLAQAAQQVARAVKKATGAEGFNLLMNNHRCSGQAIFHAHFHDIPRKTNDGIKFNWVSRPYESGQMEQAAEAVRTALQG